MNVGSVFSGVGGLDYGLQRAGLHHVFLCESDPWRRAVLRARFHGVPVYDDVRVVGRGIERVTAVEPVAESANAEQRSSCSVDLLCGGFPCQDLSVAGRRAGLTAGERSSLFFEFARVADTVRPRWLLVENVPGLLSSNGGRDFGILLGTLADLGYGLAWRVLDSRYFGVPQRRRRVFILGARADGDPAAAAGRAGQVLAVGSRCPRHPATRGETRPDAAVASLSGLGNGGPDDNDRQAGRLVAATLKAQRGKGGGGIGPEEQLLAYALRRDPGGVGKGHNTNYAIRDGAMVRRLTPVECERLQGLPDGWTDPDGDAPDSRRYASLGDAVTATVAEWIGRRLMAAV